MIDYLKLKIAHELTNKLPFESFDFQLSVGTYNNIVLHYEDDKNMWHEYEYESLDDAILKLTELTTKSYSPPPAKYHEEQEVWAYTFGNAHKVKVDEIYWDK
ncbi:hypothetical protein LRR18_17550, partial [Mangrovimonas sp. AS39]|uniref:hypothetical protein n=1 Tax=Mangrovimonas futianensis TaxID=2895523 RepID=UPI001E377A5E